MKLEDARAVALKVLGLVSPWCKWAAVAGSVRREVADVKDIEIVCIPSWSDFQKAGSLLAGDTERVNVLHQALAHSDDVRWIKPGVSQIEDWPIKPEGRYWRGLISAGKLGATADIKVDLFLARPENVGVIFAIRTGSSDFSRALVTYARDHTDYRVDGGALMLQGGEVPCPDERVVFDALGLVYVDPRARAGERQVIPKSRPVAFCERCPVLVFSGRDPVQELAAHVRTAH